MRLSSGGYDGILLEVNSYDLGVLDRDEFGAWVLPPNTSIYSATKASVDAITAILAKELGARKIRVNSINPGMIETEGGATF